MEVSRKKSSAPVSPGPIDNIVRGTTQEAALPLLSSSLLGDFTVAFAVSRLVITGHLLSGGRRRPTKQAGLALLFHVANSLTLRWIQGWIEMVLGFGKNFVLFLPHFPPSLPGTIPKAGRRHRRGGKLPTNQHAMHVSSAHPPSSLLILLVSRVFNHRRVR